MYQPYPGTTQMPEPQRPPAPASVRNAVKVMYAGAAAMLIYIIIDIATLGTTKSDFEKHSPGMSASGVNALQHALFAEAIAGGLIGAGLWIFIARACTAGKGWARITGTVFFAIATIDAFAYLTIPFAVPVKIFVFVIWLIGLAAVVLLWQRSSGAFFKSAPS
jgi:hypothetical protein